MFSIVVLIALFVSLLAIVYFILGKIGTFKKAGDLTLNLKNLLNDEEENK